MAKLKLIDKLKIIIMTITVALWGIIVVELPRTVNAQIGCETTRNHTDSEG